MKLGLHLLVTARVPTSTEASIAGQPQVMLEVAISVTQVAAMALWLVFSTVMTPCGMVLVVGVGTDAAPSIILHDSTGSCHSLPLMILK